MKSIRPDWGKNLDYGYVFFTLTNNSLISRGIAVFEEWDNRDGLSWSHCGIVTGPNKCVEALANGVVESDLNKYFDDEHCVITMRPVYCYSVKLGCDIATEAERYIGRKYGYGLLASNAISYSFAGRILNTITCGVSHKALCAIGKIPGGMICSELVAKVLQKFDGLRGVGILNKPAREITPEKLSEDQDLWRMFSELP